MTPRSDLEIRGNFLTHPFAEVIAEAVHGRLSGSLRVECKEKKSVIYFRDGRIVFAASNARSSRLFEILLGKGKVSKTDLAQVPNVANDLELATFLEEKGLLTQQKR